MALQVVSLADIGVEKEEMAEYMESLRTGVGSPADMHLWPWYYSASQ